MLKKILILLLTSFILSGCCTKQEKEVISFSTWGSVTEIEILKNVIQDFEKENPEIKVEFIHIPQNYFQKIHLLFASNTAPDVLFMNNLNLPIYESELEDLTGLIDENCFYPQAISGMSFNKKLLGIPRDISNLVLYVNLDKIPMPKSNWTIEDFINSIKSASNKSNFGIGCEEEIYWVTPYLSYFGGGILDNNLNKIIDSEKSKKALNLYKNLIYKYKLAPEKKQIGSSTLAQMFLDEKIAMYLSGRWMFPKIVEKADFNWAVINFPYGESNQLCDVSGWVISKNSKHKESAKKLVIYLSGEQTSEYFAKSGLVIPARKKMSKFLNKNKYNENAFLDVIEHSQNTPVSKDYRKTIDLINHQEF